MCSKHRRIGALSLLACFLSHCERWRHAHAVWKPGESSSYTCSKSTYLGNNWQIAGLRCPPGVYGIDLRIQKDSKTKKIPSSKLSNISPSSNCFLQRHRLHWGVRFRNSSAARQQINKTLPFGFHQGRAQEIYDFLRKMMFSEKKIKETNLEHNTASSVTISGRSK